MTDNTDIRFEIFRRLALAGAEGRHVQEAVESALATAADYAGLSAAGLYLFDDQQNSTLRASFARDQARADLLESTETAFLSGLRSRQNLLSAYMTFDGTPRRHLFTQPLQRGGVSFGTVIGIHEGEAGLIDQNRFIEALCALLSLTVATTTPIGGEVPRELIDKERLGAILETAVTVNHEVNNPLTAILGNVQLLLLKREDLDDELRTKLKTIEQSAMRIRDVTQRLLRLTSPRTVEYSGGTRMVDISDESVPPEQPQ